MEIQSHTALTLAQSGLEERKQKLIARITPRTANDNDDRCVSYTPHRCRYSLNLAIGIPAKVTESEKQKINAEKSKKKRDEKNTRIQRKLERFEIDSGTRSLRAYRAYRLKHTRYSEMMKNPD